MRGHCIPALILVVMHVAQWVFPRESLLLQAFLQHRSHRAVESRRVSDVDVLIRPREDKTQRNGQKDSQRHRNSKANNDVSGPESSASQLRLHLVDNVLRRYTVVKPHIGVVDVDSTLVGVEAYEGEVGVGPGPQLSHLHLLQSSAQRWITQWEGQYVAEAFK